MPKKPGREDDEPLIIPQVLRPIGRGQLFTVLESQHSSIRWWKMELDTWADLVGLELSWVCINFEDGRPSYYGRRITAESVLHEECKDLKEISDEWLDAALRALAKTSAVSAICYYDLLRNKYVIDAYRFESSDGDQAKKSN